MNWDTIVENHQNVTIKNNFNQALRYSTYNDILYILLKQQVLMCTSRLLPVPCPSHHACQQSWKRDLKDNQDAYK